VWPPQLQDLKDDLGLTDSRDDATLAPVLEAAIAFVERVHRSRFNFGDADPTLPDPPPNVWLGTLRLAARWHNRRRSPDGLIDMGELGSARIPTVDPDIERLLRIGRYAKPVIA
jgi:hypothetical protein